MGILVDSVYAEIMEKKSREFDVDLVDRIAQAKAGPVTPQTAGLVCALEYAQRQKRLRKSD